VLLCHLSEAVAVPLSLPRRSEAKAGRGDSPKHGDSERIREQAPRRGYSAIQYFNRLLGSRHRLRDAVGKIDGPRPEAEGQLLVQRVNLYQRHAGRAVHATDNGGVIARRNISYNR